MQGMRRQSAMDADRRAIAGMCRDLNVDADAAFGAYSDAVESGQLQGRDALLVQAASILVAVRRTGAAVTIDEIADLTGLRKWIIGKCARLMVDDLPASSFDSFLERGAKKLGLGDDMKGVLDEVAAEVRSDMSPSVRAAVVLYAAARRAGLKVTRKDCGDSVGVNHKSLRLYAKRAGVLLPGVLAK